MPIYEYRCTRCSNEFEFLKLKLDAPDPQCPACQAEGVQRLISRLGLAGTTPATGDALFESDKLSFTQRQGLKGRVPQAAKVAYNNMRAARQAEGKELTHTHLSEDELAELDPDDCNKGITMMMTTFTLLMMSQKALQHRRHLLLLSFQPTVSK